MYIIYGLYAVTGVGDVDIGTYTCVPTTQEDNGGSSRENVNCF